MNTMKRLIIVGAGGMGREVLQCAKQINSIENRWDFMGFLDPDMHALDGNVCDTDIIGDDYNYVIQDSDEFVCAIGDCGVRRKLTERLKSRGASFITLIHPRALLADNVQIGVGCILFADSIVSDNAIIGEGCFINFRASIGHNAVIGDYCTIYSNCDICGNCILENGVTMGTSSTIIPQIRIGHDSYICAGSTVMRNVRANMRVIGTPAGPLRIGKV